MQTLKWFTDNSKIEKEACYALDHGLEPPQVGPTTKHTIYAADLLFDGHDIYLYRHGRYKDIPLHNHDYFEFEYVLSGEITTIIDGETLHLKAGDLLILNPNAYHEIKSANLEDTLINIVIKREFLPHFVSLFKTEAKLFDFITKSDYNSHNISNYIFYSERENLELLDYIKNFISLFEFKNDINMSKVRLHICELLLHLSTLNDVCSTVKKYDYDAELVIKIYDYMNSNLANANLNEIAEQLQTTNYHLSKVFKQKTKKTFISELQSLRFKLAYELVVNTELPNDVIAAHIGYSNLTFFYRKFKDIYATTPAKLRKRNLH